MKVEFKRDLNHNYIKIDSQKEYFEYQVQMIVRNNIKGFLSCTKETVNNNTSFLYEISSRQPCVQVFQRTKMNYQIFKIFIESIKNIVDIAGDYMLDINSLLFAPEYMYMNPETKEVELIYLPGEWNDIKEDFHELSRKLLDWIDYKDEQVVSSAYELYSLTGEENYTLTDIFEKIFAPDSARKDDVLIDDESNVIKDSVKNAMHEDYSGNYKDDYSEDYVLESCYDEDIEKESVLKKITRPIIEATGNLFRNFTTKSKEDKELSYDSITNNGWDEQYSYDTKEDYYEYSRYENENRAFSMVAENSSGYGDTVFFQEEMSGNGRLIPLDADKFNAFELDIFPFIIGKLNEAVDGVIKDDSVSRIHAKIQRQDLEFIITDLNSTNGTFLNGKLVSANENAKLHSGDIIQFGMVEYKFEK